MQRRTSNHPLAILIAGVCLSLCGCSRCSSPGGMRPGTGSPPAFLKPLEPRYRASMARARAWLDGLTVDPLELRRVGIKGKKKLVEQLDAYYRLWQVARDAEREALVKCYRAGSMMELRAG